MVVSAPVSAGLTWILVKRANARYGTSEAWTATATEHTGAGDAAFGQVTGTALTRQIALLGGVTITVTATTTTWAYPSLQGHTLVTGDGTTCSAVQLPLLVVAVAGLLTLLYLAIRTSWVRVVVYVEELVVVGFFTRHRIPREEIIHVATVDGYSALLAFVMFGAFVWRPRYDMLFLQRADGSWTSLPSTYASHSVGDEQARRLKAWLRGGTIDDEWGT